MPRKVTWLVTAPSATPAEVEQFMSALAQCQQRGKDGHKLYWVDQGEIVPVVGAPGVYRWKPSVKHSLLRVVFTYHKGEVVILKAAYKQHSEKANKQFYQGMKELKDQLK